MIKIAFLCVDAVVHYEGKGTKAEVVERFHEKFGDVEILDVK